jgi:hypothetical protein
MDAGRLGARHLSCDRTEVNKPFGLGLPLPPFSLLMNLSESGELRNDPSFSIS